MCSQKAGNQGNMDLGVQNIRTTKRAPEQRIDTVLLHVLLLFYFFFTNTPFVQLCSA